MGGGEIALLNLLGAQDRSKFRALVCLASDGPLVQALENLGAETYVLPLSSAIIETRKDHLGFKTLLRIRDAFRLLSYVGELARFITAQQVDIVHANSLKSGLYGGVAARIAGVPMLWHVRDNVDDNYLPPVVARIFQFLIRLLPNVVVANSESTLSRIVTRAAAANGASSASIIGPVKMTVVHDGVDADRYADIKSVDPASGAIALVGRIAPWKGQHIFIDAARQVLDTHPDARFWVIGAPLFGEDAYDAKIRQQVKDLGLDGAISFLGFRSDVTELLEDVGIVVHASTIGEPFGQVVVEGMAASKPVIATSGGALPEIIKDGETGLLVPMNNSVAMADAINRLLADPEAARSMGQAARRRIRDHFTIDKTARRLEGVYSYMLRRSPSRPLTPTARAT